MRARQTLPLDLPRLWLLSDRRNDKALEHALATLPRGTGFVFRHYHLAPAARRERFAALARLARARGHLIVLAGHAATARQWRADGVYGGGARLSGARGLLRLATAHSLREITAARRAGADAIFLSPVFPTRSHPGAKTLGPVRFRLLAARSAIPVIALGGMTARNAQRLQWHTWSAIDGLS